MEQRKLLSLSVLVVRAGSISPTLLLFLAASGVGRIAVVDHDNLEVYDLHWQVIHTEGRRGTSKARSACDDMRTLNPNALVTAVMEPLTGYNNMEIVRVNDCVVDTIDNPRTGYLINNACDLAERYLKTAAMTNGVGGRGGGPMPLVSGSGMVTEGGIMV